MRIQHDKLPVWKVVGYSYRTMFRFGDTAIQISWAWMVIIALCVSAYMWFAARYLPGSNLSTPNPFAQMPAWAMLMLALLPLSLYFSLAAGGLSIAVAWHRFLLLGERPRSRAHLSIGRLEWGYLTTYLSTLLPYFLLVPLILFLSGVLVQLSFATEMKVSFPQPLDYSNASRVIFQSEFMRLWGATFSLFAVLLHGLALRTLIRLPAAAVGDLKLTNRLAWRLTKGNTLRLIGLFAAQFLLFSPAFLIIFCGAWATSSQGIASQTLAMVIYMFVSWLWAMTSIATLTALFRFFVERRARKVQEQRYEHP